jgi:hypothetical protein
MDTVLQPRALEREAGQALWFFGSRTWIKATGEQTPGANGLIEHVNRPGSPVPGTRTTPRTNRSTSWKDR